jgi:uncharacterized protein (TIGR03000 family)
LREIRRSRLVDFFFSAKGGNMKFRRLAWLLMVGALIWVSLGSDRAEAWPRRYYLTPSYTVPYYPVEPTYSVMPYSVYQSVNPYVAPYPAYGILPPAREISGYYTAPADEVQYGMPARKRPSMYPAVPFEAGPVDRTLEARRVRFEITVPRADAIVLFDGVQTKQTGLTRVFMTPPMQEDKEYTVTIDARWPTEDGTLSKSRPRTFTVTPGQTVLHTFIE